MGLKTWNVIATNKECRYFQKDYSKYRLEGCIYSGDLKDCNEVDCPINLDKLGV